ncbi:MAG: esterase [Verrucomicrobiaceae bacterium]|nr:esterase [Verrucomicrobiaceae bacterium]
MKHHLALISLMSLITVSLAAEPMPREWMIEGVKRVGLVHVPATAKTQPTPVVFAFHGHGGNMHNATRMFPIHELWPEALVVFLQGLNTPGRLTDPEGKKPGWQSTAGILGDRDLKLFDTVLAGLRADYQVDDKRIYSTGHSNGGGFTYLLWAERGDVFAAMAPSASAATRSRSSLKPKPVLHIAGENDPLVKYAWQQATIQALLKLNACSAGVAWDQEPSCTLYPSATGTPVITAIHPGNHSFPKKAPEVIVKCFKQHPKR